MLLLSGRILELFSRYVYRVMFVCLLIHFFWIGKLLLPIVLQVLSPKQMGNLFEMLFYSSFMLLLIIVKILFTGTIQ